MKEDKSCCHNHESHENTSCGCEHINHKHEDSSCGCGCGCGHDHSHGHSDSKWKMFAPEIFSSVLLIITLLIPDFSQPVIIFAYIVAVLPVGFPILLSTVKEWLRGDFFNEFTLMILACVGAFCIGEYPEGVAVLLFYSFGEKLEDIVSGDVRGQIKKLLGKMPKKAVILQEGQRKEIKLEEVEKGMQLIVKPGERVAVDGILINEKGADFNTAAMTGESLPRYFAKGEPVMSGVIPVDTEIVIEASTKFEDSSMSRIMKMIEDASAHRAPSEKVLRKISRWYTPIVFGAAVLLMLIPWIVSLSNAAFDYEWNVWLRRSLVFLICSCPCALIVSIPLTYFSSIGIASKKGILFKGHDSLDALRNIDVMMFDKTGTVTTGEFHVESIKNYSAQSDDELLSILCALEQSSSHPLAKAILRETEERKIKLHEATNVRTENHGLTGLVEGKQYVAGSSRIMQSHGIELPCDLQTTGTCILLSDGSKLLGIFTLSDTVKDGVKDAFRELHLHGVKEIGILSGDITEAVDKAKESVGADFATGQLLPEDKSIAIKKKIEEGHKVAFAGDGINDAPALAVSTVGIAMGNLGTDIAIESAQVVIAGDDLRKIGEGVNISKKVKNVIIENVTFAFGVKLAVMILGAFGIASLWAAVFADTGVTVMTVAWTLYRLKIWELRKNQTELKRSSKKPV